MNSHDPDIDNPFVAMWRNGYRSILPILPPKAKLSHTSDIPPEKLGKNPGKLTSNGWVGLHDWQHHITEEGELRAWHRSGAGIGLRADNGILGIDTDPVNKGDAETIQRVVSEMLGDLPKRIGQAPKAMYVCRTDPDFRHPKLLFRDGQVDLFTRPRQFVVHGTHPVTMRPYEWPVRLVPFDKLPMIAPETIEAFMARLLEELPEAKMAGLKVAGPAEPAPPQESLRGAPALISEAMSHIPNDYVDREPYIEMAAALKGSLPDDPDLAWDLFWKWCSEWERGEDVNEESVARKDFDSLHAPFRLGVDYVCKLAELRSDGSFKAAERWVEEIKDDPLADAAALLGLVRASTFAGHAAPKQEWLVRDLVPARNVTMLSGDGGTGKSLIMLQLGAAIATGTEWFGMGCARGKVLFLTAEDELGELHRRLEDIERANPAHARENLDDLYCVSYNGKDAVMAAPAGKDGLLKTTPIFEKLRKMLAAVRPVMTVLDTQADLFGGDENKKVHARQFIGMLQGLVNEFETTVVLISHPSMSGMASGSGMSGNTAWNNSVRSRLYFERRFGNNQREEDPDVRVLTTKKANRARIGVKYIVRYAGGVFRLEGAEEDSKAADREREIEALFMKLLEARESDGRNVSPLSSAKNYAPREFEKHPSVDGVGLARFEEAMERLFTAQKIAVEEFGPPSHRRKKLVTRKQQDTPQDSFFG